MKKTNEEILLNNDCAQFLENGVFDIKTEYVDEFYANFMNGFNKNPKKRLFYKFVKRAFDIIASAVMLLLLSPIFLIVAIAIKVDSKGPIIFKQKRIGKGGKEFNCYKFRSMRIDAPHDMATSVMDHPEQFYTKVGRVLRKLSFDELPQLWCVFVGSMSFIGYRPLVVTEKKCNDMRESLGVFEMRPGISGYAQVHGRQDVYYKNKAILDAVYVKNASLGFDISTIFRTVAVVLSRDGNES